MIYSLLGWKGPHLLELVPLLHINFQLGGNEPVLIDKLNNLLQSRDAMRLLFSAYEIVKTLGRVSGGKGWVSEKHISSCDSHM